jgi:hypothetical protein
VKAIKAALPDIRVATVDSFQGQESDFVVFSAVRAGSSHIGFVKDMQRLNVAITRAKHALVIVCDARTMESNEGWRSLIRSANVRGLLSHVPVASNGSFKQQVDHFLSKSGPFDVCDPPSQRHKQQKPPSTASADPRLQPTLQIASCAVPLPPSMQVAAPLRQQANAVPTSRLVDVAASPVSALSHAVQQDAIGTTPRPQKRPASPPAIQPPTQFQLQLPQQTQQRPSEQRVNERALAEQQRQRHLQELHGDGRTSSPVPQNQHQHKQISQQQSSSQSLQPPIKRERLNNDAPQSEAGFAARVGSVVAHKLRSPPPPPPADFNLAEFRSRAGIQHPNSSASSKPPQPATALSRPPPPTAAPPMDPNVSPLNEQLLAVERLFAVPVLCAYVICFETKFA